MDMRIKDVRQIVIGFLIIALIFYFYSDRIVEYVNTLPPIMILFVSIILSPVYVLFIYLMYKLYGFKGAIASFLISTASDIISLPHVLLRSTGGFSDGSYNLIFDTIIYNMLPQSLKSSINLLGLGQINLAVFLVYVVITTSLVIMAVLIISKKRFKEVFLKSI